MSETPLRVLDLFAGIGGFSLGLERTGGFQTVAFCEQCPKATSVLDKHWPEIPKYNDVRKLTHEQLKADNICVDVITGGFPCQDISTAGKGEGIIGERSGLWSQMFRLIKDVRPTWAIIENVSALRSKGLALVLQNLCQIGYSAEWHCIPASAVGAPHRRDRIWIVANASCTYGQGKWLPRGVQEEVTITDSRGAGWDASHNVAYPHCTHSQRARIPRGIQKEKPLFNSRSPNGNACGDVAHALCSGQSGSGALGDAIDSAPPIQRQAAQLIDGGIENEWGIEPAVGRVANGVPNRVDRLKQLGNAVVPQVVTLIGNAILKSHFEGNEKCP
jgi:DNA (cytosine-5)-methyltransferase 1